MSTVAKPLAELPGGLRRLPIRQCPECLRIKRFEGAFCSPGCEAADAAWRARRADEGAHIEEQAKARRDIEWTNSWSRGGGK